ncbi:MAG: SGNH/GDSL hydrolase family protein [Anaerolineales bacterium]|nr:SGNH/GDSL hydrolase family protein [Anaerolineales bacterium]
MFKIRTVFLFLIITSLTACAGATEASQPEVEVTSPGTVVEITDTASEAPELTEAPTAAPRPTLAADEWKTLPIVPTISDMARAIYQRGLEMGNDPNAFSKVGDCQTSTDFFLVDFDYPDRYGLGEEYAGLQAVIDYYKGSFSRQSLAVKDGFNVAAVLSPLRADPKKCEKGESPLACEYRTHKPSVAIISMETNFNQRSADDYGKYLRQIVEYTISQGIVPVLATKADNSEGDYSINAEIAKIANEYDIPLWNFWAAVDPLPNNGFDMEWNDGFHLSFSRNFFDKPKNMLNAWPWRNLTALQTLEAVRKGVSE